MERKIKIGEKITINNTEIELQKYDIEKLKKLIDDLESLHGKAKMSLCPRLSRELVESERKGISLQTIKNLSKWCTTREDMSYKSGKPKAIEISKLLFGKTLLRLED